MAVRVKLGWLYNAAYQLKLTCLIMLSYKNYDIQSIIIIIYLFTQCTENNSINTDNFTC